MKSNLMCFTTMESLAAGAGFTARAILSMTQQLARAARGVLSPAARLALAVCVCLVCGSVSMKVYAASPAAEKNTVKTEVKKGSAKAAAKKGSAKADSKKSSAKAAAEKGSAKAEAEKAKVLTELEGAARAHVQKATRTLRPSQTTKQIKKSANGYVASYLLIDESSLTVDVSTHDLPGSKYVGNVVYVVHEYQCNGATEAEALAAPCSQVKSRRMREYTRYTKGKWML